MDVKVQWQKETLAVTVPEDGKVDDLLKELESRTGVLGRSQKLIFKGKVLLPGGKLADFKVKGGAKIMMMATNGTVQTAGQAAAAAAAKVKDAEAVARMKVEEVEEAKRRRANAPPPETRADKWKKTGIVSLRGEGVGEVPGYVWGVGESARILDLGGNRISRVPEELSGLRSLQRLRLSGNGLSTGGVAWEAVCGLGQLTTLALDSNDLESVPGSIARLVNLKSLDLSSNRLASLPPELGSLPALRQLGAAENRVSVIPEEISGAGALEVLDLTKNELAVIPAALGGLKNLLALLLDGNKVETVPTAVLAGCESMHTLSLHANPITIEKMREIDGFKAFDARRKAKFDKQFEMNVMGGEGGFDEGADNSKWRHW